MNQFNTEPIRAVWCMAIQKAFEDATIPRLNKCQSKQDTNMLNRQSAISWIASKDFENVCDCLAIDFASIRNKLNEVLSKQLCQNN